MKENEMLEQTNETENVETETTEEIMDEGIALTDTTEVEETQSTEEKTEVKNLKDLLKSNPQYQEEFNNMMKTRLDRHTRKLESEYESKYADYKDAEAVLNAGLGTTNIKEANELMREHYRNEGVKIPDRVAPIYSKREVEILAKAYADEIIEDGYEAMLDEADKLAQKGYNNMNEREKIIFTTISDRLNAENDRKELLKIGAKEELLNNKDFQDFRKQFNSNVPVKNIYEMYIKNNKQKPEIENPGSMKNTTSGPKNFISEEEYDKMSRAEIRENMDLIEKSMAKW